jgi:hypothetical protein
MAGFIYIMSNPAFPNLIKIGKSKKDPTTDRVNELNQTGVPEPFKVEYYAFVEDEDYIEKLLHHKFIENRPNKNREFFSLECVTAIDAVRKLLLDMAAIKYEEVFFVTKEQLELERRKRLQIEQDEIKRRKYEQIITKQKAEEQKRSQVSAQDIIKQKTADQKKENSPSLLVVIFRFIVFIVVFWIVSGLIIINFF